MITSEEVMTAVLPRLRANAGRLESVVVARFCGVTALTVGGWFADRKPLGGVTQLKLWHLLETAGLPSPELAEIRRVYPFGEYLGRLLAFEAMTMEEARKFCGDVKDNAIFRATRGESKPTVAYDEKHLQKLKSDYGELLQMAREQLLEELGLASQLESATPSDDAEVEAPLPPQLTESVSVATDDATSSTNNLLRELIDAIRHQTTPGVTVKSSPGSVEYDVAQKLLAALGAAKLMEHVFTAEQRDLVRRLIGEETMMVLSNTTDRLCSERAFNHEGN